MAQNQSVASPASGLLVFASGMQIIQPNQFWRAGFSFIPEMSGFLCVVAILDWVTRKAPSCRLLNTMHTHFRVAALKEAINRLGSREIMNTDQGSQFTGSAWITTLTEAGARISMVGRGRFLDNLPIILIERLWQSPKQEAVYLKEIQYGFHSRA